MQPHLSHPLYLCVWSRILKDWPVQKNFLKYVQLSQVCADTISARETSCGTQAALQKSHSDRVMESMSVAMVTSNPSSVCHSSDLCTVSGVKLGDAGIQVSLIDFSITSWAYFVGLIWFAQFLGYASRNQDHIMNVSILLLCLNIGFLVVLR